MLHEVARFSMDHAVLLLLLLGLLRKQIILHDEHGNLMKKLSVMTIHKHRVRRQQIIHAKPDNSIMDSPAGISQHVQSPHKQHSVWKALVCGDLDTVPQTLRTGAPEIHPVDQSRLGSSLPPPSPTQVQPKYNHDPVTYHQIYRMTSLTSLESTAATLSNKQLSTDCLFSVSILLGKDMEISQFNRTPVEVTYNPLFIFKIFAT